MFDRLNAEDDVHATAAHGQMSRIGKCAEHLSVRFADDTCELGGILAVDPKTFKTVVRERQQKSAIPTTYIKDSRTPAERFGVAMEKIVESSRTFAIARECELAMVCGLAPCGPRELHFNDISERFFNRTHEGMREPEWASSQYFFCRERMNRRP